LDAETQTLTLEQWLADLAEPDELTVDYSFPNEAVKVA